MISKGSRISTERKNIISRSGISIQNKIARRNGAAMTNLNHPTRYSSFRFNIIFDIETDVAVKNAQDKAINNHILSLSLLFRFRKVGLKIVPGTIFFYQAHAVPERLIKDGFFFKDLTLIP